MTAIAEKVAAEHKIVHFEGGDYPRDDRGLQMLPYRCMGCEHTGHRRQGISWSDVRAAHVAEVTEAAVREQVALDIEAAKRDRHPAPARTAFEMAAQIALKGGASLTAQAASRSSRLGLLAAEAATTDDPAAFLGLDDMDMTGIDEDVACELLAARDRRSQP